MEKKPCVRCGYCCTQYLVPIVKVPELGPIGGNIIAIDGAKERCPHLEGEAPGEYSCKIHSYEWFPDTPCGQFNSDGCIFGAYIIDKYRGRKR
jgi:hypothetical protein